MEGGIRAVQLREKDLEGGDLFRLAEKTRALCERCGAALLINDRVDVALAVDAAGVQLGKLSLPIASARRLLGPDKWIGASIHSLEEVGPVVRGGANFLVFGPIYFTPSKAKFGTPQGLASLKNITAASRVPVYAIGGISARDICELRAAGARGIAVISSIVGATDPRSAALELTARMTD